MRTKSLFIVLAISVVFVLGAMVVLTCRRYVQEVERSWGKGTYFYPAPTSRGMQRLREGRLFGG